MQLCVQLLASQRTPLCLGTRKRAVQGLNAFEMIQEEFQPDQRWGLKLSQVFRVSYEARILCAHCQRDAACGNKLTRATGCSRNRSHIIPQAEMPAINPWWACRREPCAAPRAIATGSAASARVGGKGTSAGLATRPGLLDASSWRTWQSYGAWGRRLLSGAAAVPHCRATRPRTSYPRCSYHHLSRRRVS